jgi:hypothetical protein
MTFCRRDECLDDAKIKGLCPKHYSADRNQRIREARVELQKTAPPYDPRPFWEKWNEPELWEAVLQEQEWEKQHGYRSAYYDRVVGAYKRRFQKEGTKCPD